MSHVSDSLINGFIKYSVIPALLRPLDEQAPAATTYIAELIKYVKIHSILDSIFSILLGYSLEPECIPPPQSILQDKSQEGKTTQISSIREILIERCISAEDRLS